MCVNGYSKSSAEVDEYCLVNLLLRHIWFYSGGFPPEFFFETIAHGYRLVYQLARKTSMEEKALTYATFGAGCFWCVEAIFQRVKGVEHVQSGYSGGTVINPSYREVCTGRTGHAEVVQIAFDEREVTYSTLLEVFFAAHDPTTLNRQGGDVGTQYRSVIFYHDDRQKAIAEKAIAAANDSGVWSDPVVTELSALTNFFSAEDEHKDYFALHGDQPYCAAVIRPKVAKFTERFRELLKES